MRALLNRLGRDRSGLAALELAFFLPILLIIAGGVTEVGRALYQAQMLDKSLRAGAVYAAHQTDPFSTASKTAVENLVKTGDASGTEPYLLPGFAASAAKVDVIALSYDLSGDTVPVIRITVEVPFEPMFPIIGSVFDPSDLTLRLSHEQAHIGT